MLGSKVSFTKNQTKRCLWC